MTVPQAIFAVSSMAVDRIIGVADKGVLVHRIFAMGDRLDFQHRVHPFGTVGAGEFAERRFGAAFLGADFALDHDFGVGRHVKRDGLARHQRHRALQDAARDMQLV